jgi:hypothetical protein
MMRMRAQGKEVTFHTQNDDDDDDVKRSTAQHSTAQHSTAQHSTAQHSTAQRSTAQHLDGMQRLLHELELSPLRLELTLQPR